MKETSHIGQSGVQSKLEERVVFFFVCVGVIAITLAILFVADFLPEKPTVKSESVASAPTEKKADALAEVDVPAKADTDALPVLIIIDSLDKQIPILNPESDSVEALDTALLSGAIRHPDSADFTKEGTIFLLGHSSYLPNVMNKNFQAFNGIQKLVWGDVIRLRSADTEYVYSVDRVYEAKASDAEVAIQHDVAKLTLATCNSFGTKDDRFVVEATLVSKHAL